jgi:hypothetical protein
MKTWILTGVLQDTVMLFQNTEFLVTKNPIFVESIAKQYFQHLKMRRELPTLVFGFSKIAIALHIQKVTNLGKIWIVPPVNLNIPYARR